MKKILALSLSFVVLSQAGIFAANKTAQATEQTQINPTSWKDIKSKKLEVPEITLLSALFAATPVGILRMDLVQKEAIKLLQSIDQQPAAYDDKAYVQEQITRVVKPVEQFFIIARDYKSVVKPLLLASIGEDCFIMKAYETDGDICKFLETHVETKEMLQEACIELLQFFKDLKESLSSDARSAYIELRKQLAANAAAKKKK